MKKIKQFSLKATLLTIVAALTIGFTGCSDELSGDQTQGKPGYLTVNLRTLKTKQTKFSGANALDYQTVKDFNIFVVNASGDILFSKFTTENAAGQPLVSGTTTASVSNDISLQVGNLPTGSKVVVIANWGIRITGVTTLSELKDLPVNTVKAFDPTKGLVMTGEGAITAATGLSYTSAVTVSPVSAKISVKWSTTAGSEVAQYFDITGIYIVNAIKQTKLPIVGGTTITDLIVPATKLVSTGYDYITLHPIATPIEYYLYAGSGLNVDAANLYDQNPTEDAIYHYYVGENYHKDIPTTAGGGSIYTEALTNSSNANTLILIEATPKTTPAAAAIYGTAKRYYTYDLSSAITNNAIIPTVALTGFSTKRKTNYNVNFTLNNAGTSNPFEQIRNLTVTVTASGWDDVTTTPSF